MTQYIPITIALTTNQQRNSKDSLIAIVQLTKRKGAFFLNKAKDEKEPFLYSS